MALDDRKALGSRCEALAADYLERRGLRVKRRNFRTRLGEVDLICEWGELVIFVEVKARRSRRFGSGCEAVDWRKQQRLMTIAQLYMAKLPRRSCRFDVVVVSLVGERAEIEHIPNAFP